MQELPVNGQNGNTEVWFYALFLSTFLETDMNVFCYFQDLLYKTRKGDCTDVCDRYQGSCRN